ncbi:unnamed protein product [Clonostachys rosea]|uniref:Alpha/beta hydrolase fold-3 domain-containing protein n=1 Tax=Bionectria ochroleuca TaxID=29856 RepID=A0ABY6TZG5_BIOOC|nr:unnamed protein product [Clonostachys rosea]
MEVTSIEELESLCFETAPPADPAWLQFSEELGRRGPAPQFSSPLERQPVYAEECRQQLKKMTAPDARDHSLIQGIHKTELSVASSVDHFHIPVLQLDLSEFQEQEPETVIVYYHGGGLAVGEADSEELTCRRMLKSFNRPARLYSVGYRLMPKYPAEVCVSDSIDAFLALSSKTAKNIVVGSSSGGQLAATVCQRVPNGSVYGLLLRCPVTSDPSDAKIYIPERYRHFHTSRTPSFVSTIFQYLKRSVPRDGLDTLPLEATRQELLGHPRTWIQLCSLDTLYSDGLCYGMALFDAGVKLRLDIQKGWPHTFWLKAPELPNALEAENSMLEGLRWLAE